MLSQMTQFLNGERGAAALETALILPFLVTLTFGVISFGSILFVQNNMLHAARETARTIAVGDATLGDATTIANNHLVNWSGLNFTVTSTEPTANDVAVQITVPVSEAALVDVLGIFGSGTLNSQITFRKES